MFGLKQGNSRVYRGMQSETPEELEARLRRIGERIREKVKMARACKENPLLHCIIPQYEAEIRGHLRAREKIKGLLIDKRA